MLAESGWTTLLDSQVIGTIMGCAIPLTAIIGLVWYHVHKTRAECELKQTLAARGMSPDEIVRVVQARPGKSQ